MNHRADIGDREKIEHLVLAGLDVHLHLGEPGDVRLRDAVAPVIVVRHSHQPLAGQRRGGRLRDGIDVLRQLVPVVDAAEINRLLRRLGERHARARRFERRAPPRPA